MNIIALILDDERLIRSYVKDLVQEFLPDCVVYTAKNPNEALSIINTEKIDILFLDVKMPQMDGFEFLQLISDRDFELIFITAYGDYAIKAIRESAFDYLLKPVKKSDFQACVERVAEKINDKHIKRASNDEDFLNNKLCLTHQQGVNWIKLQDIIYFEANNTYTIICLAQGNKLIMAKAISRFEQKLNSKWFFRIHKSYLINLFHFREYSTKENGIAIMSNGDKLNISRYKLAELLNVIKDISGEFKL